MNKAKYIITSDNSIIIFDSTFNHSDFRHFNPIRAGFISFGSTKDGNPSCLCQGESYSLKLGSDSEQDTLIAKLQLGMEL